MIIGLSGYAQTGKDTIAQYLVENYGYKRIAFADPIREALYTLNPQVSVGEFNSVHVAQAVNGMGWEGVKRSSPETRRLLQVLGTEVGRDMFGMDFWVDQAFKNVDANSNIVFTDVRFPNEYSRIKYHLGKVFRVTKPGIEAVNAHKSETELDNFDFDGILDNSGSIEDLHLVIDNLINTL